MLAISLFVFSASAGAAGWLPGQTPDGLKSNEEKKPEKLCTASYGVTDNKNDISKQFASAKKKNYTIQELNSCLVTARQAKEFIKKGKVLLVDVRDPIAFESVRIESALNLPEHTISEKSFLRHRPFVLIGKGHRTHELARLCVELKKKGFKNPSVIEGGIVSWLQEGYELKLNDLSATKQIMTLSPRELVSTAGKQKWTIASVGLDKNRIKKIFSSEYILEDLNKLHVEIKYKNNTKNQVFSPVLIVGAETYEDSLVKSLHKKGMTPVFYLQGGIENYLNYRRVHKAKVEHAAIDRKKIATCPGS